MKTSTRDPERATKGGVKAAGGGTIVEAALAVQVNIWPTITNKYIYLSQSTTIKVQQKLIVIQGFIQLVDTRIFVYLNIIVRRKEPQARRKAKSSSDMALSR